MLNMKEVLAGAAVVRGRADGRSLVLYIWCQLRPANVYTHNTQ